MENKEKIEKGMRFGFLTITGNKISNVYSNKIRRRYECLCDCGSLSLKLSEHLLREKTKYCSRQCPYHTNIKHNLSRNKKQGNKISKEYSVWSNIINHCKGAKSKFGSKGITYSEEFSTIQGFLNAVGRAPSPEHQLHRIDKEGDFEVSNVHWILRVKNKKK